jgi:hypothetical protein
LKNLCALILIDSDIITYFYLIDSTVSVVGISSKQSAVQGDIDYKNHMEHVIMLCAHNAMVLKLNLTFHILTTKL